MPNCAFPTSAGIPHLGGAFRQDFGAGNSILGDHHQQKPRLSLWLDQANSQLNPMDHNSDFLMPNSSTGLPDIIQMASNNLFGSNSSMGNYANLSLSPLPPQPQGLKEEPVMSNQAAMGDSLASLYSDNQNSARSPASAPMSATALLQKAAQMGSTKSSPAFFGNAMGVMNSSSPSSSSTNTLSFSSNPLAQNRSELHNAMMSFGEHHHVSLHSGLHGVEHSLTRDFLGMGGDGGAAAPFLPQELVKFASMNPGMGLTHFTSNH